MITMLEKFDATPTMGYKWPRKKIFLMGRIPIISLYRQPLYDAAKLWSDSTNFNIGIKYSGGTGFEEGEVLLTREQLYIGACFAWVWKSNKTYEKAIIYINKDVTDDVEREYKAYVFAHELGHCMGLDHVGEADKYRSIMGESPGGIRTPQKMDIDAVNSLYSLTHNEDDGQRQRPFYQIDEEQEIIVHILWARTFNSLRELYEASDVVIEGTINGDGINYLRDNNDISTLQTRFDVTVDKIYKGYTDPNDPEEEITIKIARLGGHFNGAHTVSEVTPRLNKNDKVVLFLKEGTNIYHLLNENTGVLTKENHGYRQQSTGVIFTESELKDNFR